MKDEAARGPCQSVQNGSGHGCPMAGDILFAMSEASPDALICANPDGIITFWNSGATRLFGLGADEAIGQSIDLIVPEPMRGAHAVGMRRLANGAPSTLIGRIVEVIARRPTDGHEFPIEMSLAMWERDGVQGFGALIRDISECRRNEERLHQLAHFDQLTLVPNRTLFIDRLQTHLTGQRDGPAPTAAVIMIDLDGFKDVNDLHGHGTGDELLKAVALRLRRSVFQTEDGRPLPAWATEAIVARLGGDEFAVLLPGLANLLDAVGLADRMRRALAEPFHLGGRSFQIGASMGIAMAPQQGSTPAELMGNADLALYRAKSDGGNRRQVFLPTLRDALSSRRNVEAELRRAWASGEFAVYVQPQVRLPSRAVIGAEALLRWQHPERGLIGPQAFITELEGLEIASAVGEWVLREACRHAAAWRRQLPDFGIGVNLFASQLGMPHLSGAVAQALADSGLPAEALELEITETAVLGNDESWIKRLKSLRDLGVGLAFDDYGTGYASLSLLKRYPLTRLKIDRSFVRDVTNDSGSQAIVEAVLSLGARFGLGVIAEGVETPAVESLLVDLGCTDAPGYLYGKAMTPAAVEALIGSHGWADDPAIVAGWPALAAG